MSLRDDLTTKVFEFVTGSWSDIPSGYAVPTPENLTQGNTGKRINATVLYADIHGSTSMVDALADKLAAEYYKAFLHCAAKIIRSNDGTITAYDGDRVMGIYVGNVQAVNAIKTALQLAWAVNSIINPACSGFYGIAHRPLRHTVGIDCGLLLATKAGVRNDNDLVWIGAAANYAAKLNSFNGLEVDFPTRATERVVNAAGIGSFYRTESGLTIWDGPYADLKSCDHYRTDCTMPVA